MLHTESKALSGLPPTLADVCDFRTHGPRMRLDDLPNPSRRFVDRVSASSATVDSSPGRGGGSRTDDDDFDSVFAVPTVTNEDSAEAPAATKLVAQPTPSRSSVQETDPVEPTGPTAHVPTSPGSPAPQTMTPFSDRISTRTRGRSATPAGKAPPAVEYGFVPGGVPRPSSRRVTTPPRARRPRPLLLPTRRRARYHFRLTTTTQILWELHSYGLGVLLMTRRLNVHGRMPTATLLSCGSRIPSRVIHMPIGSANNTQSRRATPRHDTLHLYRPAVGPVTRRLGMLPLAQSSRPLGNPGAGEGSTTYNRRRHRPTRPKPDTPADKLRQTELCGASCLLTKRRASSHLRSHAHAPLDHATFYSTASCHLGTTRTLRMLERF